MTAKVMRDGYGVRWRSQVCRQANLFDHICNAVLGCVVCVHHDIALTRRSAVADEITRGRVEEERLAENPRSSAPGRGGVATKVDGLGGDRVLIGTVRQDRTKLRLLCAKSRGDAEGVPRIPDMETDGTRQRAWRQCTRPEYYKQSSPPPRPPTQPSLSNGLCGLLIAAAAAIATTAESAAAATTAVPVFAATRLGTTAPNYFKSVPVSLPHVVHHVLFPPPVESLGDGRCQPHK